MTSHLGAGFALRLPLSVSGGWKRAGKKKRPDALFRQTHTASAKTHVRASESRERLLQMGDRRYSRKPLRVPAGKVKEKSFSHRLALLPTCARLSDKSFVSPEYAHLGKERIASPDGRVESAGACGSARPVRTGRTGFATGLCVRG